MHTFWLSHQLDIPATLKKIVSYIYILTENMQSFELSKVGPYSCDVIIDCSVY